MQLVTLLLLVGAASVGSHPVIVPQAEDPAFAKCSAKLQAAGASPIFGINVAHGTHSVTLEHLQMFKPEAGPNNGIPVVNRDLNSHQDILFSAPDIRGPDSHRMVSDGLKLLDLELSNMDRDNWELRQVGTLGRLAHEFHMLEMRTRALPLYRKLQNVTLGEDVCKCATDIQRNGVLEHLHLLAELIRHPEIINFDKVTDFVGAYNTIFAVRSAGDWQRLKERDIGRKTQDQLQTISFDLALYLHCSL